MPRLERSLYERLFNTKTFGRARTIAKPRKPVYKDVENMREYVSYLNEASILGKLLQPFTSWYHKNMVHKYQRDIAMQRGYIMDDIHLHEERELRRSPFMEHVWRESTHPYHWLFFKARRRRYYKVERTLQGYFVPDYVKNEVKQRTTIETMLAADEWNRFMHENYYSDMTPSSASGVVSEFILSDFMDCSIDGLF